MDGTFIYFNKINKILENVKKRTFLYILDF